jgi:hypothetical protein
LLSWAIADWVIASRKLTKRTRVTKDKRQQIGEVRLNIRASLETRKTNVTLQNARSESFLR